MRTILGRTRNLSALLCLGALALSCGGKLLVDQNDAQPNGGVSGLASTSQAGNGGAGGSATPGCGAPETTAGQTASANGGSGGIDDARGGSAGEPSNHAGGERNTGGERGVNGERNAGGVAGSELGGGGGLESSGDGGALSGDAGAPSGGCANDVQCASQACDVVSRSCVADACKDHHQDGSETDADCGGSCAPCQRTQGCATNDDCVSHACDGISLICVANPCIDNRTDGSETDVDCGGNNTCGRCHVGKLCSFNSDCLVGHVCGTDLPKVCQ